MHEPNGQLVDDGYDGIYSGIVVTRPEYRAVLRINKNGEVIR